MIDARLLARILDMAMDIQQIPAPSLDELKRGEFVRAHFEAEGLTDVFVDEVGNVLARLPGEGTAPAVVVSAHLDTVFPASTPLDIHREGDRICGPGIGDNSLGVAGLFGLLWMLKGDKAGDGGRLVSSLPHDLWLVANVGEEGLGNLRGMRAVVDRFGESVLAYLILEGMALGQVYHRALGVERYRIEISTQGGHSWVDYGRPSAIHELAALVTELDALAIPNEPRTSLNVGTISGGVSINTIAPLAYLELDLRSEGASELDSLSRQVKKLVKAVNRPGVETGIQLIGERPAGEIAVEHPLVKLASQCLIHQGLQPNLAVGSTDANLPLSRGLPAVCVGLTSGYGAHTTNEYIYTQPLAQGMEQFLSLVEGVCENLAD